MNDLSNFTTEQLEAALAAKKEQEHEQALRKREAYEGIRAELVQNIEGKVRAVREEVKGLHGFCVHELTAFRETLQEYGQLRHVGQMNYTLQEGDFRIEVRSCKVKRFDERADVAATRLIDFLKEWIEDKEDGLDNPMYQLAMTLLERNKNGDLDYKSISKLYELEDRFNDAEYSEIMKLFKEAHLVEGTSTNFYFFERNDMGVWVKLEVSFNRM